MVALVTLNELEPLPRYEEHRKEVVHGMAVRKRRRRMNVGERVSLLFECRDFVWYQVQEMSRAEHITTPAALQDELDTYNTLIPGPGQLRATMFVEVVQRAEIRPWLQKLKGIEQAVVLEAGSVSVRAVPDEKMECEEATAAVHYLTFDLPLAAHDAIRDGLPATVRIDLDAYAEAASVPPNVLEELARDLAAANG